MFEFSLLVQIVSHLKSARAKISAELLHRFSALSAEYLNKALQDFSSILKDALPQNSEQTRVLDNRLTLYNNKANTWPEELKNLAREDT